MSGGDEAPVLPRWQVIARNVVKDGVSVIVIAVMVTVWFASISGWPITVTLNQHQQAGLDAFVAALAWGALAVVIGTRALEAGADLRERYRKRGDEA